MQGFFKVTVHDASHLGRTPEEMDRPFLEAIREGRLMEFLETLRVVQEAETQNQIFHTLPRFLGYRVFGMPDLGGGFSGAPGNGMSHFELNNITSEPTYTEYSTVTGNTYASSIDGDSVNASHLLWKRFIEDSSEPYRLWIDQGGREGYYFRNRFLWLPSDGLMPSIRGARTLFGHNADATGNPYQSWSWFSRTRFKDSGGNPITMEKTDKQSFLAEYTLKFFSR